MDKFDIFFEKVQNTAKTMESKFFVQSSEGRDFETEEMEGEDLFGWLIPNELIPEFQKEWMSQKGISDKWDDFMTFALWDKVGNDIKIIFRNADEY
jgi:hypothetical protein